MTKKQLLGLIIALFGISMFLQIIGIGDLLFWPLFFLIAGYFLKNIPVIGLAPSCISLPRFYF